jgi:predicted RNase H-like HicB family nuclease
MKMKLRDFNVIIERDSDGFYVGTVAELHGCHSQAKSLDVLMSRMREAIDLWLEVEGTPAQLTEFVGVQRLTVKA